MTIRRLVAPDDVLPLALAAHGEGFTFLGRLLAEWADGTNRFERPGEALFGAYSDGALVGTAGLTRQGERLGRVRRVYVHPDIGAPASPRRSCEK